MPPRRSFKLFAFCAAALGAAGALFFGLRDRNELVRRDGSILYYNAPAAVSLTVQIRRDGERVSDTQVHDFAGDIDTSIGATADDHAAPAFFDARNGMVLLSAAYHSTERLIFEARAPHVSWTLRERRGGRYADPRFFEGVDGRPMLAFREIATSPNGVHHGHLRVLDVDEATDRFAANGSFLIGRKGVLNPQHVRGGRGYLYVSSNREHYDIRDFDTSLHLVTPGPWRAIADAAARAVGGR